MPRIHAEPSQCATRRAGGTVFWLLLAMGFGALTPCVLLPEWRTYQALKLAEGQQEFRLQRFHEGLDRDTRLLEALTSDKAVISRLAQRDLGYHNPDEQTVAVAIGVVVEPSAPIFTTTPVKLPLGMTRIASLLPNVDYDAIFCDPSSRRVVIALAVGLICSAFALFGPRRRVHNSI